MAPKRRGCPRGGRKDSGIPPIPAANPPTQAAPQEGGMSNPQMATFFQEFMAKMRRQASPATSVPPPSPVIPTPAAFAHISPVPISSAPAVLSWKIYTEFQKVVTRRFDGTAGFEQVGSWFTEVERGFRLLKVFDDLKVDVGSYMLTVEDEQSKADRFLWGLNLDIYLVVNQFKPATYREAANRAIDQEKAMARVKTQDPQKVGSSFKKRKFDESRRPSISAPPKSDTDEASKELRIAKTVGQASAAQRTQPAPPICHTCGRVGHTRDQCRVFTGACYRCSANQEVQKQNVGVRTKAQQARVHVMTHQEAAATDALLVDNSDFELHVNTPLGGVMTIRDMRRTEKLSPRYIGPYPILERIGEVAYRFKLPGNLAGVHDVFHVSLLQKHVPDPSHNIDPEPCNSGRISLLMSTQFASSI
ncbi:hypothetical protein SLEP1_g26158 [Rubroshorea leprosula]|uniref:CCHC-type domain-containing protein n=1 Tax=Rubroshorea leprosula TaxID=152421 RepID=A0AAV5JLB1_9ROSI|nr:hypothetical protein SLEP1_g26158 [Rubroshorea leprosula]